MNNRRSAISIMLQLIVLVKPLIGIMLLAILLGTIGYLCAISLTILASYSLVKKTSSLLVIMVVIAIARGLLHYVEQYCNHYIAFKLLAIIRHKVFAVLRKLCPAKLEGKDSGNLVSLITSDIELLEVFYAHTISPIAIAFLTSLFMVIFIGHYNLTAGLIALCFYIIVGVIIPIYNGKLGKDIGMQYRNEFGDLNSFVLDSLRGLNETIHYQQGIQREKDILYKSDKLAVKQEKLNKNEANTRSLTNIVILVASLVMLFYTLYLYNRNIIDFEGVLICTVAMMGSFGPTVALANLSNNLNQTLASGDRVLSLLEETPLVNEIDGDNKDNTFSNAKLNNVTFAYKDEVILDNYNLDINKNSIVGICGPSGSGKSTILKLLMRFWEVNKGNIEINNNDINNIPTKNLRNIESYVTQETHLFHDTIANNIAIANLNATKDDILLAAKKASIDEFIQQLPNGYDSQVGELGDNLSAGEKQRLGIARAFLHNSSLMLLDEPTSNLDALNEGIILKSLIQERKDKTIVLVSHRKSTLNIADKILEMKKNRVS